MSRPGIELYTSRSPERTLYQLRGGGVKHIYGVDSVLVEAHGDLISLSLFSLELLPPLHESSRMNHTPKRESTKLRTIKLTEPERISTPEKLTEKSRECHNYKPQPTNTPREREKLQKLTRTKQNKKKKKKKKCTRSTQTSSLFPKPDDYNAERNDETWGQRLRENF